MISPAPRPCCRLGARRRRDGPAGRRALFLDRDGVINVDTGYVHRREDFVFADGIFPLCAAAGALGLEIHVATNQAGIGRGLYTEAQFAALTGWMVAEFAARGIVIAAVHHCPDHPDHGLGAYRRASPRRKPEPGMLLDAAAAHGLDLSGSAMLGDKATDMQAAAAAGLGLMLLLSDDAAEVAATPDGAVVVGSLAEAAARLTRFCGQRTTGARPDGSMT